MLGELGITGRLIVVVILLLLGQNSLSLLENITGTGQTDTIQLETYTPRNKEEAELEKLLHLIV